MTPLDTLAPDQRAVLELVLRQGRSYGELSELLGIPEHDVRDRADAGLRALAGEPGPAVDTGRIADWLLGQQRDADAGGTRAAVERSAPARAWAATAAERLRELGGAAVPEVSDDAVGPGSDLDASAPPRPAREPDASAPLRPAREPDTPARRGPPGRRDAAAPRPVAGSSKLGGAIVIAVLVLVVGGVIVFVLTRGGDDRPSAASQQPDTAGTPTPTPTAVGNDIVLRGTNGSRAAGLMRLVS